MHFSVRRFERSAWAQSVSEKMPVAKTNKPACDWGVASGAMAEQNNVPMAAEEESVFSIFVPLDFPAPVAGVLIHEHCQSVCGLGAGVLALHLPLLQPSPLATGILPIMTLVVAPFMMVRLLTLRLRRLACSMT